MIDLYCNCFSDLMTSELKPSNQSFRSDRAMTIFSHPIFNEWQHQQARSLIKPEASPKQPTSHRLALSHDHVHHVLDETGVVVVV